MDGSSLILSRVPSYTLFEVLDNLLERRIINIILKFGF